MLPDHVSVRLTLNDSGEPSGAMMAHLIGACGAGMTALAEFLHDRGWRLRGSDQQASLISASLIDPLFATHAATNIIDETELVVFSPAIPAANPEREEASRRGLPQRSYPEMVAELMRTRRGVCVAGTHGKTTTTGMVATALRNSGREPSALIGGRLAADHRNGWSGSGDLLVVEACEYRKHFLHYHPQMAAILNIEADHFDCFPTLADAGAAFVEFATQVQPDGLLVINSDSLILDEVRRKCAARVETFERSAIRSTDPEPGHLDESTADRGAADWSACEVTQTGSISTFRVLRRRAFFAKIELSVPGRHNVDNALAAIALLSAVGLSPDEIAAGLKAFKGIWRRMQVYPDRNGVTLIDDYAHHPTAVAATLKTIREVFPGRRIVCAFQAHQVSRIQNLRDDFAASLSLANEVLLVPVYAAREKTEIAEQARQALAGQIQSRGVPVRLLSSLDHLLSSIEHAARSGEVWVTMGAGDIDSVLRWL